MSNESKKDADRRCLPRLVLWTWQGCGYLEGYGYHPGSGFVAFLIALGAAAGAEGGWIASLIGAGAMSATFGLLYLVGAYGRAKDFHSQNNVDERKCAGANNA
jgi:hypothetical protein